VAEAVFDAELIVISEEPLLAVLRLKTDPATYEFGINSDMASGMIDMLVKFVTKEAKPS
jgi:hypothetical protein